MYFLASILSVATGNADAVPWKTYPATGKVAPALQSCHTPFDSVRKKRPCNKLNVTTSLKHSPHTHVGSGPPAPPPPPFRFASSQGDGMVLQRAPAQATVWGFVAHGSSVSVSFGGQTIAATTSIWMKKSTWLAKLPATKSSLTQKYNITATSDGTTITLGNVLFGEVWVCSGQSNMAYPIGSPTCWNASNVNCTDQDKRHNTAQCGYGCSQNAGKEIP